jgi:hypothetical protein
MAYLASRIKNIYVTKFDRMYSRPDDVFRLWRVDANCLESVCADVDAGWDGVADASSAT